MKILTRETKDNFNIQLSKLDLFYFTMHTIGMRPCYKEQGRPIFCVTCIANFLNTIHSEYDLKVRQARHGAGEA